MGATKHVELPAGVVTLLFSDIEGSTQLLHALGDAYGDVLADHHRLLREVWAAHQGVEVDTEGDAFFVAFSDPGQAIAAATAAQRVLADHAWPGGGDLRVRMGVHSGVPRVRDGNYWGIDVHYAARLCAAANGGQVLVSAATAGLVDVEFEDLGEHAVKDFPAARRIFHLPVGGRGSALFSRPRTLQTGQTNLPDQLSSFVGRVAELTELRMMLASTRLLTLTGFGGVGKTRLALRLASEVLDGSGDGVWFVDLASLADPDLVASHAAEALGVAVRPGRDVTSTLTEALSDRRMLVVLDNCEHVIAAAAALVVALLVSCEGVAVLATSREPLRVTGEQVYRVPSLSTPIEETDDLSVLARSEAVTLFVERATQHASGFALDRGNAASVAVVCRRLDGIPLALELAAVRLRSMSVADLNARLNRRLALLKGGARTAQPRQQTLLALIDWSYQLLSERERIVLARLSVFAAGGFDLEAAEAVCDEGSVSEYEVLDHLDSLVDKSLLQAEDTRGSVRFRLLETVREFASARLVDRGPADDATARLAHRDYYLSLAEAARVGLQGPERRVWLDRLSADHDNLRAALTECEQDRDPGAGLRLASALSRFWGVRGHAVEGARIFARYLQRPDARQPTLARADALAAATMLLANGTGELDTAQAYADEALQIARRNNHAPLTAAALRSSAVVSSFQGDYDRALQFSDEALAIADQLEDGYLLANIMGVRGQVLANLGGDARPDFERAVEVSRQIGSPNLIANGLQNLGYLESNAGDHAAARHRFEEALSIHQALGETTEAAFVASNLAFARYMAGERTGLDQVFKDTVTTANRYGFSQLLAEGLLGAALTTTNPEAAARLHGAADAVLERFGYELDVFLLRLREDDRTRLKTQMGDAAFTTHCNAGRQLRPEDTSGLVVCSPPPAKHFKPSAGAVVPREPSAEPDGSRPGNAM